MSDFADGVVGGAEDGVVRGDVGGVEVRLAGAADLPAVYALRHEVFVVGQDVPVELERDEHDDGCDHAVALRDGRVVGTQELGATEFAVIREVATGSWLGLRHQGRGIGTEMRAAVLMFAFDALGATRARSAAFVDNPASLRVSDKLGYRPDGSETVARRGVATDDVRLLLTPDAFRRPDWGLAVDGVAACLPMLEVSPG